MRELKTGRPPEDWCESSSEETESSSQEILGSLEQLDLLFEKEQGVVRRAGWLSFKPLLTVHKDHKLELVGRRKWKQFWVTLKGRYAMIAVTTTVIYSATHVCAVKKLLELINHGKVFFLQVAHCCSMRPMEKPLQNQSLHAMPC